MKTIKWLCIILMSLYFCSCVTWLREENSDIITQGMVGAIIETKFNAIIAKGYESRSTTLKSEYFIFAPTMVGPNLPDKTYVVEHCPAGTRGKVIQFIKERDASQHIWSYVEFEMDDPRLKQKYRIIRMVGLRGNLERMPWSKNRDFRVVKKMKD